MKKFGNWVLSVKICLGLGILILGITALVGGCGQQQSTTATTTSSTTTTTMASGASLTVRGTTSSSSTGLSIKAGVAGATVSIGYCTTSSDAITAIASGTTGTDGAFAVTVAKSAFETAKDSTGRAQNIMVTISGTATLGCVIATCSPDANAEIYAGSANPGGYNAGLIARKAFKKGSNPKTFNYNENIGKNFSDDSLSGSIDADKFAEAIKAREDTELAIATGLGIPPEVLALLKQKGFELHNTYIEPILRAAFAARTPPNRAEMDAAMTTMFNAMKDYAVNTLGLTEQQFSDLTAIKDRKLETELTEAGASGSAFEEAKRRMMAGKTIAFFQSQWSAANTLATFSKSSGAGISGMAAVPSFATTNAATYAAFVASSREIESYLTGLLSNTSVIDLRVIPEYLRSNFFDTYLYPPPSAIPTFAAVSIADAGPSNLATNDELKAAVFQNYKNSRIMVYFMFSFFPDMASRGSVFAEIQNSTMPIFNGRFQGPTTLPYYMGPAFWSTNPSAADIQTRSAAFKTAIESATLSNTTLTNLFATAAGFTSAQTQTILKVIIMLSAPPNVAIL